MRSSLFDGNLRADDIVAVEDEGAAPVLDGEEFVQHFLGQGEFYCSVVFVEIVVLIAVVAEISTPVSLYDLEVPGIGSGLHVEAYHGTYLRSGFLKFRSTVAEESRLVAPVVDYGLAFPEDGFERDVLYEFNL